MISGDIVGYRRQPVKSVQSVHNTSNNDLFSIPNIIHWLHQNTTGILDDNVQLLRSVLLVGLPDSTVDYLRTRHCANTPERVVVPTDFTNYDIGCAAVCALGPLDRSQDIWLASVCHGNTNTWRNWCLIHATPIDSITHINDYDICDSCMRHVRRYTDILSQASGRQFDLLNLLPGRHCASIFNSGIADWTACGLYYDNESYSAC